MKEISIKLLNDVLYGNIQYTCNSISMYKVDRCIRLCKGQPAVYVLIGNNQIYIGQTSNIYNRLYQHSQKKDFWDTAVFFVNDNRGFTLTEIKWLEEKLIKMMIETFNFTILSNYQIPNNVIIDEKTAPDLIDLFNTIKLLLDMFWLTRSQINNVITNNKEFDIEENTYKRDNSKSIVDRIVKASNKHYTDIYEPDEDGIVNIITDDIKASYFDIGDGRIIIGKDSKISSRKLSDRVCVLGPYSNKIQNLVLIDNIVVPNEKIAKQIIGI